MRLFIDGGSLHAVTRCLNQTGNPGDATRQLHIASQLAFADKLFVGSYGGGVYLEQTHQVLSKLAEFGFDPDCIEVAECSTDDLEQIYLSAAISLAPELFAFTAINSDEKYNNLSVHQSMMEQKFHEALVTDLSIHGRLELYEEVKAKENNGHLIMLAKCDTLWEVCREIVQGIQNWSPHHSAQLASVFRIFIHHEYANKFDASYAPGVDRARALRKIKIPEYVWSHIQDMPGKAVNDFKLGSLGVPSISAFLASKAQGDPRGLMAETLRVRDKAKPLRNHLKNVLGATKNGDESACLQARREMEQLSNDLKVHLAIKPISSWVDAFDIFNPNGFLWSLFSGNVVGGQKIISVITALRRSKRIAVLSEMAAEIEVSGINPSALAALERSVLAKTPKR